MASRKRRTEDTMIRPTVAESNICTLDPNPALLRRVFFLNEGRNKYISVAFYRQQGYSVLIELGVAKSTSLRLTEHQFATLTEHLPGLIQALCADEYYISGVHDNFRVVTGGSYRNAWFNLGLGKNKKEVALKLHEQLYLNNILYLVANQEGSYSGAIVDVMNCSTLVMASNEFIEPQPHYSKQIYRATAPLQQANSVPSIL
jgi:hypothetical protein